MPIRKTPLRESAGVRLVLCEEVSAADRVVSSHYRLSTMRANQPRVLAAEADAQDAFDLEVIASLADPVVQKIMQRSERRGA